jgi:hypothetical protein
MKWITREKVKVDRVACPWPIRKFVHPAGEGLRWVAFGFSALGLTDHEIVAREFIVYDALYAECRRRIDGGIAA